MASSAAAASAAAAATTCSAQLPTRRHSDGNTLRTPPGGGAAAAAAASSASLLKGEPVAGGLGTSVGTAAVVLAEEYLMSAECATFDELFRKYSVRAQPKWSCVRLLR